MERQQPCKMLPELSFTDDTSLNSYPCTVFLMRAKEARERPYRLGVAQYKQMC